MKTTSECSPKMAPLTITWQHLTAKLPNSPHYRGVSFAIGLHILLILGLYFSFLYQAPLAQAETFKVRKTYGHWHVSCGVPPGSKSEKCALVQDVTDETRPNYSLRVIFLRSQNGEKEVLRVVAPLGVLLPTGLGLKIDNADMGHAPFMKCGKIGCIAEVVVTNQIVTKFKTGKNAIFIIFQTPEVGIGFPVSLSGFNAGYKTLK